MSATAGERNLRQSVRMSRRRRIDRLFLVIELVLTFCCGVLFPVVVWFTVYPQFPELAHGLWAITAIGWLMTGLVYQWITWRA